MKELWTKEEAEFHGQYYDFPLVRSFPKRVQQPHPPIFFGDLTGSAVFRRIVAWGWLAALRCQSGASQEWPGMLTMGDRGRAGPALHSDHGPWCPRRPRRPQGV